MNQASPITTAARVPVLLSNLAANKSPVVNPFTLSDQRLTFGTIRKETMTILRPDTAIIQEPDRPNVKPSPPIAILNPPPISVAAALLVVCKRFIFRSAARKESY